MKHFLKAVMYLMIMKNIIWHFSAHTKHIVRDHYFGLRHYNGKEYTVTARAVFTAKFDDNFSIVSGTSYLADNIEEIFDVSNLSRTESVPGIFAEATIKPGKKMDSINRYSL
jgi:hypothetical protein